MQAVIHIRQVYILLMIEKRKMPFYASYSEVQISHKKISRISTHIYIDL